VMFAPAEGGSGRVEERLRVVPGSPEPPRQGLLMI
jgi:hypothetical protein